MRRLPRSWPTAAAAALALVLSLSWQPTAQSAASALQQVINSACALPHQVLLRTWEGARVDRSGEIQMVANNPNFVSGGLTHATPFDYTQQVPIFFYGAPYINPGTYTKRVTSTDIAPTEGQILHYNFNAPDGSVIPGVVNKQAPPPRLLVTLVWDSGGMDVLNTWKKQVPYLHSLIPHGAWFTHATVGSSPSDTPPIHAEIGTGAYPRNNGMLDEYQRVNKIEKPNQNGPAFLLTPTLADLYDRAMGNKPIVGEVATLSAHISMMSHGSMWGGGDRDIAITREKQSASTGGAESLHWGMTSAMAPFYLTPHYVNQIPGFQKDITALDRADGKLDGNWMGNSIAQLNSGFDTPARTPYQTSIIESIVTHEGFGQNNIPDLLYINYKAIDTIGHLFSLNSPEMQQTVKYQDDALRQLVAFLNKQVGKGKWAMVLTADHGTQYSPSVSHAFLIGVDQVTSLINQRFGKGQPIVDRIRPTQIWLHTTTLQKNGYTLADVAAFVQSMTEQQTAVPSDLPLKPGTSDNKPFLSAFPTDIMSKLPCLPEAKSG